jgi:TonB-linked SusC/RagA family outer membrane protein
VFNSGQNYYFNGSTINGYAQLNASNPDVTWETSIQSNLGVDLSLFKNKLSVTADIYERRLKDMLLTVPVPLWLGQNSPLINAGSMTNHGWELAVTHRNQFGKFRYDITANLADVKNEVTDLANQDLISGLFISRVGNPLNSYYGYVADGLFQTDAEVAAAPVHSPTTKTGDIRYKDISGVAGKPDGKIDQFDRVILGHNFPRYEYSLNTNASWKGLDINIFLQGVGKRDTYISGTGAWAFHSADFISTAFKHHLNRWTPTNPNASYPRLTDGVGINQNSSSYWMQDGSYLRLKNLAIGYTLPAGIVNALQIKSVRFYVSGSNLLTFDNYYPGFDPEKNEQNGEFYPVMKTFTIGANIRF